MANNMDEFDQDGYDAESGHNSQPKKNMSEAWASRPMVKLGVIMAVVGVGIAGALGAFSGAPKSDSPSRVVAAPALSEPPGGKSSPYFIEQNKQANEQRATQAMEQGGSSLPTPSGQNVDIMDLTNKKDSMAEFRAETERLKQEIKKEQQATASQIQTIQKTQRAEKEDDSLAQAMQKQMRVLMEAWEPRKMEHVKGGLYGKATQVSDVLPPSGLSLSQGGQDARVVGMTAQAKTILAAGTVNYGQILTEANSDIPGPVLVQIASGPLAGGRAVGQFTTANDYLVIRFNLVSHKGKEYRVNAIALDPNTTLAGMATEVDHRYLDRLVLPAAAAFISTFGQTMGQTPVKTSVTDGGVVVVDQASKGTKEAMYDSLGVLGKTAGRFFEQRGSQIKTLVRVAVGTPMGIFFLESVKEPMPASMQQGNTGYGSSVGGLMASGYQQGVENMQPYASVNNSMQNARSMATDYQNTYRPSAAEEYRRDASGSGVYYPQGQAETLQNSGSGVYRTK